MAQIAVESKNIEKETQLFTQALTLAGETQDAISIFPDKFRVVLGSVDICWLPH